ncbi:unnamed protein product [Rhizopus stolonifer]
MESLSTFWHPCYGEDLTDCHCDWRITLNDCVERQFISKLFTVCLSWNAVLIIPTISVLYDRIIVKKRVIFERVPHTLFIRPKPIEALIIWMFLFIIFRIIDFAIILFQVDVNPIFQSVLFDLAWEFGLCATTCYVFGLAHTVSNTSEVTKRQTFISRSKVDIGFTAITLIPFLFNTICSILSAVYAQHNDYAKARIFTVLIYAMWVADCVVLAFMTIYFGLNILKVFEIHLNNRRGASDPSVENVKNSLMRMKAISVVLTCNYLLYAIIKSIYCIGRDKMMVDKTFNIALCTVWNLVATINVTLVLITLIFNPKLLNPLSFSSNSSNTEAVELSADKLEKSIRTQDVSSSVDHQSKDYEEQKNFYNMVIESARNKVKKDEKRYSYRQSISQTNLISN